MSAFLADLLDVGKTAGGIVFGAAISWFATRYSDAIRERRDDFQRAVAQSAALQLVMSSISYNLTSLIGIFDEAKAIEDAIIRIGDPRLRVTGMLRVKDLSDLLVRLIDVGAPYAVICKVRGALHILETVDAQLTAFKEVHNSPQIDVMDLRGPFRSLLRQAVRLTDRNGTGYNEVQGNYLDLDKFRIASEEHLHTFYKTHPLKSYIFKKD